MFAIGCMDTSYRFRPEEDADYGLMAAHGFRFVDHEGLIDMRSPLYRLPEADFAATLTLEREKMERAGLRAYQVHSPWPTDDTREDTRAEKQTAMERAVRGTKLLGSDFMVVHPVMPYGWEREDDPALVRRMNIDFLRGLCDYARDYGVGICLENMPMTAHRLSPVREIVRLVEEIDHENLFICLDTGHAHVFGEGIADAVRLCGAKLRTLHVHDNRGDRDSHLMPFAGTIDWTGFAAALREVGFTGPVSLETDVTGHYPRPLWETSRAFMAETARALAE